MPVTYDISPELNLIIYICSGTINIADFFKVADEVTFDARLKEEMKIIIDVFSTELEILPSDLHMVIEKNREMAKQGRTLGQLAIFTKSSSLRLLADAFRLMSTEVSFNFGIFNTSQDAIRWLNLAESEQEVIKFWQHTKALMHETH